MTLRHPVDRVRASMGYLRLVGSIKLQVSFAEYCLFYRALLQKRPTILSILLNKATPYWHFWVCLKLKLNVRYEYEFMSRVMSRVQIWIHNWHLVWLCLKLKVNVRYEYQYECECEHAYEFMSRVMSRVQIWIHIWCLVESQFVTEWVVSHLWMGHVTRTRHGTEAQSRYQIWGGYDE